MTDSRREESIARAKKCLHSLATAPHYPERAIVDGLRMSNLPDTLADAAIYVHHGIEDDSISTDDLVTFVVAVHGALFLSHDDAPLPLPLVQSGVVYEMLDRLDEKTRDEIRNVIVMTYLSAINSARIGDGEETIATGYVSLFGPKADDEYDYAHGLPKRRADLLPEYIDDKLCPRCGKGLTTGLRYGACPDYDDRTLAHDRLCCGPSTDSLCDTCDLALQDDEDTYQ